MRDLEKRKSWHGVDPQGSVRQAFLWNHQFSKATSGSAWLTENVPAMRDPKIMVMVMKYLSLKRCHRSCSMKMPHQQKWKSKAGMSVATARRCLMSSFWCQGASGGRVRIASWWLSSRDWPAIRTLSHSGCIWCKRSKGPKAESCSQFHFQSPNAPKPKRLSWGSAPQKNECFVKASFRLLGSWTYTNIVIMKPQQIAPEGLPL